MNKSTSISALFETIISNMSAAEIKTAMVISDVSSKIEIERINKGMTQKQFAEFMGVTQSMVSKWESGNYNFTVETIAKIFDKLNLDFDFNIHSDNELKKIITIENSLKINFTEKTKMNFKEDKKLAFVG